MIFLETKIKGAFLLIPERMEDERGFFAKAWCRDEFQRQGLATHFAQMNISFSKSAGTLRGLHFQLPPYEEAKVIRCTQGAIFDVIVDVRESSPTYKMWVGVELSSENYKMLYVPEGVAHGFQTLRDGTEVVYPVTQAHVVEFERGIRWDDPQIDIQWPAAKERIVSEKDRSWPNFAVYQSF